MFIMIDGIDGSGKSSVIQAFKEHLAGQGTAIFDLKKYQYSKQFLDFILTLSDYFFLLFAIFDRLDYFLWLAGFGSNVFAMALFLTKWNTSFTAKIKPN